jgi:hypothetical protein
MNPNPRSVLLVVLCCVLSTGCETYTKIVNPQGPKNAALIKAQAEQIDQLRTQVASKNAVLAAVAGNIYGVQQGAEHVEAGKGKDIVVNEAELAAKSTGPASADKKVEADARVVATLKGDLAEQKRLYGVAAKQIDARDKEIADRDAMIASADTELGALKVANELEKQSNKTALEKLLKEKNDAIDAANDAHAKSLQRWAAKILIGSGIAVIVCCGGFIFMTGIAALSKAIPGALGGLLLIGSGVIVGQKWFLWVAGAGVVAIIAWAIAACIHVYHTGQLEKRLRTSVQDLKDEAQAGVPKAVDAFNEFKAHLNYRLGDSTDQKTTLQKVIDKRLKAEGAIA